MRIVVLGAGALGSLVGGLLAARHDVVLVGRRPHTDVVEARGLRLSGLEERTVELRATDTTTNLEPADVLLVTVKAHSTAHALGTAGDALGPDTFVLSLQNGLGNVEAIAQRVGPERTIGATTSHGARLLEPGHVAHTGPGKTVLGPLGPPDLPAHHELAEALTTAGIETEVVPEIGPALWEKAAINAAINPLTAITGLPNGALLEVPALTRLLDETAREVEAVARARGLVVDEDAWVRAARRVAERTAKNRSSMLQDVERGRPTEIDAISGVIAAFAEEAGVEAPRNRALHALVRGIEATLRYDA